MMNEKCFYFVEGECEAQLIHALKLSPARLISGRVKVYNTIQELIPKSVLLTIQTGTTIALAFDTDKPDTTILRKNIELIKRYCKRIKIVYLPQVLDFEDEMVWCTDVGSAIDLTHSRGLSNFKTDFCRLKASDCRLLLERHHFNADLLWSKTPPVDYEFVSLNSDWVKTKQA